MPSHRADSSTADPNERYSDVLKQIAWDARYDSLRVADAVTRRLQAPDVEEPGGIADLVLGHTAGEARYCDYLFDVDQDGAIAFPDSGTPDAVAATAAARDLVIWHCLYVDALVMSAILTRRMLEGPCERGDA